MSGILTANARVLPGSRGSVVLVELDPRQHRFLGDHIVDSSPLLSTVMGIETIACAIGLLRPGTVVASIADVRVGPPFLLPPHGTGVVEVTASGTSTLHCELRSAAQPMIHFAVEIVLAEPDASPPQEPVTVRAGRVNGPAVEAANVYQLFFHGESFRVVASAALTEGGIVGRLALGLPPIVEPARVSMTAPLLIELCLQSAGLWELATLGTMTIPDRIARIRRYTQADSDTRESLTAVVRPRRVRGRWAFDAAVVDDAGQVHVVVEGYRTIAFGQPHDVATADRIRAVLTGEAAG